MPSIPLLLILLWQQPMDSPMLQQAETLARRVFTSFERGEQVLSLHTPSERDELRAVLRRPPVADTLHILVVRRTNGHQADGSDAVGYVVITNVRGKDQPITFGVVLDERLRIRHVEVLAYREPYGGEIRNASWLRQFLGRGPDEPLRPGREIRNITGATISVRSVTLGVQDILATLRSFRAGLHVGEKAR